MLCLKETYEIRSRKSNKRRACNTMVKQRRKSEKHLST